MAALALTVADRGYVLESGPHRARRHAPTRWPATRRWKPPISAAPRRRSSAHAARSRPAQRAHCRPRRRAVRHRHCAAAASPRSRRHIAADAPAEDVGGRLVIAGLRRDPHPSRQVLHSRPLPRRSRARWQEAIAAGRAPPSAPSPRTTSTRAAAARWRRRSCRARRACARMWRSIRASACASFDAIRRLKRDYAWAIDLEICVFPQEGLLNDPGTEELLVAACEARRRPDRRLPLHRHAIRTGRSRASSRSRAASISTSTFISISISIRRGCISTRSAGRPSAHRWGGRVAVGPRHQAFGDAAGAADRDRRGGSRDAGVAVTVLPATDLFLMGREHDHNVPRGVTPAHRLLRARRDLLARHQQRAQPVHAVRRLLADADGQPLRQHRAGSARRRSSRRASTW